MAFHMPSGTGSLCTAELRTENEVELAIVGRVGNVAKVQSYVLGVLNRESTSAGANFPARVSPARREVRTLPRPCGAWVTRLWRTSPTAMDIGFNTPTETYCRILRAAPPAAGLATNRRRRYRRQGWRA
jgi:hypothetical protein